MDRSILFISIVLFFCPVHTWAQNRSMATPVLIELFTSQGCSSCPPAEALLSSWGMDLFRAKKALPLAFHVDYWDYLGWSDPYSSAAASDRQRNYGAFFRSDSIYTPQMIVQGQIGFNGADRIRAELELSRSQSTFPALGLFASIHGKFIRTKISVPPELIHGTSNDPVLCVVLFENGLTTSVERGENGGRTLNEDFVVRSWRQMTYSDFKKEEEQALSLPNPGVRPSQSGVAIWLQDPQNMKVSGLHWVYPLSKN